MTGPNPFADDLRAAAETRERSAADLANPYAAPPGGREYQAEAGPGVGIWRLHDQVVIHQSLDFPERCIFTNELGIERRTLKLSWYTWFGLSHCSIKFDYSLSESGRRRRANQLFWPMAMLGGGILCHSLAILADIGRGWLAGVELSAWCGLGGVLFFLIGFVWLRSRWRIMRLDHHEGPYFVLGDAGAPFLQSLPRWPGLK